MDFKRLAVIALGAAFVLALALSNTGKVTAAAGTDRYVSNTGADAGNCSVSPCFTIQYAVNQSVGGDTINVAAGTYNEQVKVTTSNLTITGAGAAATTIRPATASVNSSSLFSGADVAAIVVVDGATGVTFEGLTVDGQTAAAAFGCAPTYVGVFYRAASGSISRTHVTNIFNPAVPGCQNFLAIFVQSGNGGPGLNSDVVIDHNTVDNYGKNGITANEAGTSVTVTNNTVTGRGAVGLGDAAQNGVQLGFGAHGKVTDNAISGNNYTPASFVACGILATNGGGAIGQTKTNAFSGNEQNVCNAGGGPSMNSPFNR